MRSFLSTFPVHFLCPFSLCAFFVHDLCTGAKNSNDDNPMYKLSNHSLEVAILDPVADQQRLGTRYCTGGYIFQVTDHRVGELLSGPTYPDSFNPFDGQGIPDAFNRAPLAEPGSTTGVIPGIGVCDLAADRVLSFCEWHVTEGDHLISMSTRHQHGRYDLELERKVSLTGRTVRSASRIRNNSGISIPIRWFPHPFFPQPDTQELCRFNVPVFLPDNDGYAFARNGFICRKTQVWETDYYQAVDMEAQSNLVGLQRHPKLGLISAACSYVPTYLPLWGNTRTISWEPYLECTVASGQEKRWHIDYIF